MPPIWQHWQRILRPDDGGRSPIRANNVLSARPTASNGRPCPKSGTCIRDASFWLGRRELAALTPVRGVYAATSDGGREYGVRVG